MKRFHIHVSVHDLSQSVRFYSTLFGTEPSRVEAGVAWETFHTLGSIPAYGEDTIVFSPGASTVAVPIVETPGKSACCVPAARVDAAVRTACCSWQ